MISLPRVPTTAFLFACIFLLGCEKDSPPSDKTKEDRTAATSPEPDEIVLCRRIFQYHRCCDGTTYCFFSRDRRDIPRLYWLVNGKSVSVDIDKDISSDIYIYREVLGYWSTALSNSVADIHGGLYIAGKKHLWYLRDGKISLVKETTVAEIKSEEHQVSQSSILWYFWEEYTLKKKAEGHYEGHEEGHAEGHEEGYAEGYEEGHAEGYGEGREADY